MENEKRVIHPEWLSDLKIERTIFSENDSQVGVATLSQEEHSEHILRIFQLLFNYDENAYEYIQELAAFTFQNRAELVYFLDKLPHLTGLEMLMLLNPLHPNELH